MKKKSKKDCRKKSKTIYYSEKRTQGHPENSQRLVEEVQKIKRLKFDNIFFTDEDSIDKENLIFNLRKKSPKSDV
jgi:hypothetical protein